VIAVYALGLPVACFVALIAIVMLIEHFGDARQRAKRNTPSAGLPPTPAVGTPGAPDQQPSRRSPPFLAPSVSAAVSLPARRQREYPAREGRRVVAD
jgi:hypothetical protein